MHQQNGGVTHQLFTYLEDHFVERLCANKAKCVMHRIGELSQQIAYPDPYLCSFGSSQQTKPAQVFQMFAHEVNIFSTLRQQNRVPHSDTLQHTEALIRGV